MTTQVTRGVTVEERQQRNELIFDHWLAGWTETEIAESGKVGHSQIANIINHSIKTKRGGTGIVEQPPIYNVWNISNCDPRFGIDYPGRIPGQIMRQLRLSRPTIHLWVSNNSHRGLSNNSTILYPCKYEDADLHHRDHVVLTAIAKELGVNHRTIGRWQNNGNNTQGIMPNPPILGHNALRKLVTPRYLVVNQAEIANAIGIAQQRVAQILENLLGAGNFTSDKSKVGEAIRLYLLGWVQQEISERVGLNQNRVSQIINNGDFANIDTFTSEGKDMSWVAGVNDGVGEERKCALCFMRSKTQGGPLVWRTYAGTLVLRLADTREPLLIASLSSSWLSGPSVMDADNFALTHLLRLMPASAASILSWRCTCAGTLAEMLPLHGSVARGSGTFSPVPRISATTSPTTLRIPCSADSGVSASQLRLGNSAHKPTYSPSSLNQVTRYVYRSLPSTMLSLQSFDCLKYLSHLIGLCFALVVLNVHPWITLPRRFIYPVTTTLLSWLSEVVVTDFAKLGESNILWILSHQGDYVFNITHRRMLSLMLAFVKPCQALSGLVEGENSTTKRGQLLWIHKRGNSLN